MADVKVTMYPDAAIEAISGPLGESLYKHKESVLDESAKIVPFLTGRLLASGRTEGPYADGDGIAVKNLYDTPYALDQHETREYKHGNAGEWKYLEKPENAAAKRMVGQIAKDVGIKSSKSR